MKTLAVLLTIAAAVAAEQAVPQVLAKDPAGVVVYVKEKYGTYTVDTCTVLMLAKEQFVLVHREGGSSWYPVAFHSVEVVESLGKAVASAEAADSAARVARAAGATK